MAHCKANQLDMHGFCAKFDCPCIQHNCRFFGVKTNADRIRAMSDEELAMQFADFEYRVAKEVCAKFGVDITTEKHDFEAAAKDHLELLQQPAEGD